MKNKKLLVSLAIVAVVVVIIVVMASVFTVRDRCYFRYYTFSGDLTTAQEGGVPSSIIEEIAKGKSAIFLSKTSLLAQVNAKLRADPQYSKWYAFAVVKSFPNVLDVCLVEVTAIAKLMLSNGEVIYLDSFGVQVAEPTYSCIDITSAFDDRLSAGNEDGMFKFVSAKENERLGYVLEAILATWQCYVEIDEMNDVLLPSNAFKFDSDGSLLIHPRQGGTIRILSPDTDLAARIHKAYGVYYNPNVNLQNDDCVITVYKNGRVKTPDPNK